MTALTSTAPIETAAEQRLRRRLVVMTLLAGLVAAGVLVAMVLQELDLGSKRGGWTFDYYASWLKNADAIRRRFTWDVIAAVLGSGAVLTLLAPWLVTRWERTTVALSLVAGTVLQVALRSVYKHSLPRLIKSWGANSFWTVTNDHPVERFVSEFDRLGPTLAGHAKHNMPGKVLLYYFLELFTKDVTKLGVLIIALSTLGGLFVYLITRDLTGDRRAAIFALALSCVIPSKLSFLPILNTVTPLLIFAALWLLVRALDSHRLVYAALLGPTLYVTLLFEPLPLVLGIVFAALVLRSHWGQWKRLALLVLTVALSFLALHALIWLTFHFDILRHFARLLDQAKHFNVQTRRSYDVWVKANLVEFFITGGIAASMLTAVFLLDSLTSGTGRWWQRIGRQPVLFLTLAFLLNLLVVDLLGVNRGEVSRLWIFFTPFPVIAAAQLCGQRLGTGVFRVAFGLMLMQCAVHVTTVGFINP